MWGATGQEVVTLGSGGKILLASDATPSSSIAAVMGISHSQASEMGADIGLVFFPPSQGTERVQ